MGLNRIECGRALLHTIIIRHREICLSWSRHSLDWVLTILIGNEIVTPHVVLHPGKFETQDHPVNAQATSQNILGLHRRMRSHPHAPSDKVKSVLDLVVGSGVKCRTLELWIEWHKVCVLEGIRICISLLECIQ